MSIMSRIIRMGLRPVVVSCRIARLNKHELLQKLNEYNFSDSEFTIKEVERALKEVESELTSYAKYVNTKARLDDKMGLEVQSFTRRERIVRKLEQALDECIDMAEGSKDLSSAATIAETLRKVLDDIDTQTGVKKTAQTNVAVLTFDPVAQMQQVLMSEMNKPALLDITEEE